MAAGPCGRRERARTSWIGNGRPRTPPPFTTIAWRICHIAVPVLGIRASSQFGDGSVTVASVAWPATAAEGIALLEVGYAAWKAGLKALDEAALARPTGTVRGAVQRASVGDTDPPHQP